jgi:hypothetical protein
MNHEDKKKLLYGLEKALTELYIQKNHIDSEISQHEIEIMELKNSLMKENWKNFLTK